MSVCIEDVSSVGEGPASATPLVQVHFHGSRTAPVVLRKRYFRSMAMYKFRVEVFRLKTLRHRILVLGVYFEVS